MTDLFTDPLKLGLLVAAVATVVIWAAAVVRRLDRSVVLRGLRVGLAVSLVIGAAITVLVTVVMAGRPFIFTTLDFKDAFFLGLLLAAPIAVGFFWIGSDLLLLGLLFRRGESWATRGAWFATPIAALVGAAVIGGIGALRDQQAQPTMVAGSASLQVSGEMLGAVAAAGDVQCRAWPDGMFRLDGGGNYTNLTSDDPRPITIYLVVDSIGNPTMGTMVGNLEAFPGKGGDTSTTVLEPGWSRQRGALTFNNLVPSDTGFQPSPTERWSGRLTWDCPF